MAKPQEKSLQETFEAVDALRKEVSQLSPDLEKIDKINTLLDKQEEQNQKLFQKYRQTTGYIHSCRTYHR